MVAAAQDAIIEVLASGRGRLVSLGSPSSFGWRGETWEGLPHTPRLDTIRFLTSRGFEMFELFVIEYEDDHGDCFRWTCRADFEPESSKWRGRLVSGGRCDEPGQRAPWANLGGSWGRDGFTIGGSVHGSVVRVELEDRDGRVFVDSVLNGYVLFGSNDPVRMPLAVRLLDASGTVVVTQTFGS